MARVRTSKHDVEPDLVPKKSNKKVKNTNGKPKKAKPKKVKKSKKKSKTFDKTSLPKDDSQINTKSKNKKTVTAKSKAAISVVNTKTPVVVSWLKRAGHNVLGVLDDVLKGSHHHILTKQLLMAGGALILAGYSWHLSDSAYHHNLKTASYDETIFSEHNTLSFSTSGTTVTSTKLYKSADGKTVYLPVLFANGSTAQMPRDASQLKTKIAYAGSVIESSKLSAEFVGYPAPSNGMFYVYVIHKPDPKYQNVSSSVTTTVTSNLTASSDRDTNGKLVKLQPDTLTFTVDFGSKKAVTLSSNDDDANIKSMYSKAVFEPLSKPILDSAKDALASNSALYNQSDALIETLTKSDIKVPSTPQYATRDEVGNFYNVNFKSSFIKGYFGKSDYDTLKRQYLTDGYTDVSSIFNAGMDSNILTDLTYSNGKAVPTSDEIVTTSASDLTRAWQSIIQNKSQAYVNYTQQLFGLQYQFDFNLTKGTIADNSHFTINSKDQQ